MKTLSWNKLKQILMEKRWRLIVLIAAIFLILLALLFPIAKQGLGSYLIHLGEQYLSESQYEEAVLQFEKAIQIVPKKVGGYDGGFRAYMALERVPSATQILVKASDNLEKQDFRTLLKRCLSDSLYNDWYQTIIDGLLDSGVSQEDLPEELQQPVIEEAQQPVIEQPAQEQTEQKLELPPCFTWRVEPTLEFDDIQPINEIGSRVEKDGKYGIIDYDGNIIWDTIYSQITVDDIYTGLVYMDTAVVDGQFQIVSDEDEAIVKGNAKKREEYYAWDLENGQLIPLDATIEEKNNKYREQNDTELFYLPNGYTLSNSFIEGVHTKTVGGKTEITSHTGTYALFFAEKYNEVIQPKTDFVYKDYFGAQKGSDNVICAAQDLDNNWKILIVPNVYAPEPSLTEVPTECPYTDPKQLVFESDINYMVNTEGFHPSPYLFTNNHLYYQDGQWECRSYEVHLYMQNDTLKEPGPDASIHNLVSAPAMLDGKWGYIGEYGNQMIPGLFEEVRPFYGGKAWVKMNGKWGVIQLSCSPEKIQ